MDFSQATTEQLKQQLSAALTSLEKASAASEQAVDKGYLEAAHLIADKGEDHSPELEDARWLRELIDSIQAELDKREERAAKAGAGPGVDDLFADGAGGAGLEFATPQAQGSVPGTRQHEDGQLDLPTGGGPETPSTPMSDQPDDGGGGGGLGRWVAVWIGTITLLGGGVVVLDPFGNDAKEPEKVSAADEDPKRGVPGATPEGDDAEDAPQPKVSRITAVFVKPVTTYRVEVSGFPGARYEWDLEAYDEDGGTIKTCGTAEPTANPTVFVWNHPHKALGGDCPDESIHGGILSVTIRNGYWNCDAEYRRGSASGTGEPVDCFPVE